MHKYSIYTKQIKKANRNNFSVGYCFIIKMNYYASQIGTNVSAFNEAPPINPPSISG
jgi:hypothetical protein